MPSVTSGSSIPNDAGRQVLGGRAQDVAEDVVASCDRLVGRQDDHDLVLGPVDGERRERDGAPRCCGRAARASERAHAGACVADESLVAPVGHDRDVVGQAGQPVDRPPGGASRSPSSGRNGFGRSGRLSGMEAGPTATGQDHGVHAPPILRGATRCRPVAVVPTGGRADDPATFGPDEGVPTACWNARRASWNARRSGAGRAVGSLGWVGRLDLVPPTRAPCTS